MDKKELRRLGFIIGWQIGKTIFFAIHLGYICVAILVLAVVIRVAAWILGVL